MNEKLKSGRYILTIIGGVTFGVLACSGGLSQEVISTIITMIFVSYFNRKRKEE